MEFLETGWERRVSTAQGRESPRDRGAGAGVCRDATDQRPAAVRAILWISCVASISVATETSSDVRDSPEVS